MTRIVLALTFPLRYYAYVRAPAARGPMAAAPLELPAAVEERIAA